jgi:hypothetical protein
MLSQSPILAFSARTTRLPLFIINERRVPGVDAWI